MESILKKLKALMEKEDMHIVEYPSSEEFEVSIIRYGFGNHLSGFYLGRGDQGMSSPSQ